MGVMNCASYSHLTPLLLLPVLLLTSTLLYSLNSDQTSQTISAALRSFPLSLSFLDGTKDQHRSIEPDGATSPSALPEETTNGGGGSRTGTPARVSMCLDKPRLLSVRLIRISTDAPLRVGSTRSEDLWSAASPAPGPPSDWRPERRRRRIRLRVKRRAASSREAPPTGTPARSTIQELCGDGEDVQDMDLQGGGAAAVPLGPARRHLRHRGAVHERARERRQPVRGQQPRRGQRVLPPLQRLQRRQVRLPAGPPPHLRAAPAVHRRLRPHHREEPPVLEPQRRRRPLHGLLPRLGLLGDDVEGKRRHVQELHPNPVQRQHVGGLRPEEGRAAAGGPHQGPETRAAGPARVPLEEADAGVLRRRGARADTAGPAGALEGEGRRRRGARVPAQGGQLRGDDAEEQVLPLPERVRGGQPQGGGGHLRRLRPGADIQGLRRPVQRRARLVQVLGPGAAGEDTGDQDDTSGGVAAAVPEDAEEGGAGAEALRHKQARKEVRHDPHGAPFYLAQKAQPPPSILTSSSQARILTINFHSFPIKKQDAIMQ